MKFVVGIGEALFDCLPEGRKLGGAPANFAYHVSQFGLNGCAISAIGDDELGEEIVETFERVNLNHILPKVEQPTGTVLVTLDEKGIPQYDICLGVAWDNIPLTDEMIHIARHAEAICFGSLAQRSETSRRTIQAFLDASPKSALRVFDINLRQRWFTADVIALHPKVVVIMAGTNDVAHNDLYVEPEHVIENIVAMCELAKANGIVPIISSIPPCAEFCWRKEIKNAGQTIVELNNELKAYAKKNGFVYVDYHKVLAAKDNSFPLTLSDDGCHPLPDTYFTMEEMVKKAIKEALRNE